MGMTHVLKLLAALLVIFTALSACSVNDEITQRPSQQMNASSIKFAAFNVSFAHDRDPSEHFEQWIGYMNMPVKEQNTLINAWKADKLSDEQVKLAERIMQIRNVAAIIQKVRPDVLLLNEFNNDGTGENTQALEGFQKHYLSVSQSMNSVDGGDMLEPILYPFAQSYATNTGLPSAMDLANTGEYDPDNPNNAYGFGYYHGHYAFALMSKYEIDTENTRSFQSFKRKDLPGAVNPKINVCSSDRPLPNEMSCGDTWFSEQEWQNVRLSSKNHVDAPIKIPTQNGFTTIHALLSHPTPAAFDTFSDNNKYRNSEENLFWLHYIDESSPGHATLYDDERQVGGIEGKHFVIMGDQNADTTWGRTIDERFNGIQDLMFHPLVNQSVTRLDGEHLPVSSGALTEPNRRNHPHPQIRTATFGTRADYSVPSASLKVIDSGVYWPAEGEPGRLLFNDARIGERGSDKEISSDHRLVWVTVALPQS